MSLTINSKCKVFFDTRLGFNTLNGIYLVKRVLSYEDIIEEEVSIYEELYKKIGIPESLANTDLEENYLTDIFFNLINLNTEESIWVPSKLVSGYSDPNVKEYKKVMLSLDLGLFDDPATILGLKYIAAQLIKAKVGTSFVKNYKVIDHTGYSGNVPLLDNTIFYRSDDIVVDNNENVHVVYKCDRPLEGTVPNGQPQQLKYIYDITSDDHKFIISRVNEALVVYELIHNGYNQNNGLNLDGIQFYVKNDNIITVDNKYGLLIDDVDDHIYLYVQNNDNTITFLRHGDISDNLLYITPGLYVTEADGSPELISDTPFSVTDTIVNNRLSFKRNNIEIKYDSTHWTIIDTETSTNISSIESTNVLPPKTGWSGGVILDYTISTTDIIEASVPETSTYVDIEEAIWEYDEDNEEFINTDDYPNHGTLKLLQQNSLEVVEPTVSLSVYGTKWLSEEEYRELSITRNEVMDMFKDIDIPDYYSLYMNYKQDNEKKAQAISALQETVRLLHTSISGD